MTYNGLVLFSGGLDSILAAKILQKQGLKILCAHFYTPFFGNPEKVEFWQNIYDLEIAAFDVSALFIEMLVNGPEHGFGKNLNPCVDCKILLLRQAKNLLPEFSASFLATGEVVGQRPMSQRKDSLYRIQNKAEAKDLVLRPLSAKLLEPVLCERSGLVNREQLMGISGRGRDQQFLLAKQFALREIPAPAGGCLLTQKENTRRFWHLLAQFRRAGSRDYAKLNRDFRLCLLGRQYFKDDFWLCVGRNAKDNASLKNAVEDDDILLRIKDFPGPLALARNGKYWPQTALSEAAALTLKHSPRAMQNANPVKVELKLKDSAQYLEMIPGQIPEDWGVPNWEDTRSQLQELRKK